MNTEIGKQIAALRKKRGIKQEELAKFVGVSTQAVSKWENGGVPDIELLPKIADFFSVSIDYLFEHKITNCRDLQPLLIDDIIDVPHERRIKRVFDYCWDMERALTGDRSAIDNSNIYDFEKSISEQDQHYSSIMTDYGFTRMGIANRSQYFLIVPEPDGTEAAYFEGIDYPALFKDFSDRDVFNACVMLNKRDRKNAFTHNLLIKSLGITFEKANEILETLTKYNMLKSTQIELDGDNHTVYHFIPTPSFIALLIFAREIIDTPHIFTYRVRNRKKPYLN